MKRLLTLALMLVLGASAVSAQTFCYGWEDGDLYLDCRNCDNMTAANVGTFAHDGSYSLEISALEGTTPEAYVAWVTDLQLGDSVDVSMWVRDLSVDDVPSVQFWASWTANSDIDDYQGSAFGPDVAIGSVSGEWQELTYTYTVDAAHDGNALRISIKPYGDAATWGQPCWVDDVCLTIPDDTRLHFPGPGPVDSVDETWGGVKVLFK